MQTENGKPGKFISFLKDYLAIVIVIFSFAVVILLLIMAFSNLQNDVFQHVKDLMGLVLPIIGTWMGTILAFYFSKENFESASRSMQQTISKLTPDDKLRSIKAKDVMIPLSDIAYPADAKNKPIEDLLKFLNDNDKNRIVVMDENKVVNRVIHRSIFDGFIADQIINQKKSNDDVLKYTIDQMKEFGSSEVKNVILHGVEFIQQDANLYEAQQLIMGNENCQDVFLTANGKPDEPIVGWITDVIITKNARV